jgi:hypothetical protein
VVKIRNEWDLTMGPHRTRYLYGKSHCVRVSILRLLKSGNHHTPLHLTINTFNILKLLTQLAFLFARVVIASFGVLLGFHTKVGTEFVPNTRLDPLMERRLDRQHARLYTSAVGGKSTLVLV